MDRALAEDGILALLEASELRQHLDTLEVSDGIKAVLDEDNQLLIVPPAAIIQPGPVTYSGHSLHGNLGATQIEFILILVARNYRSPSARAHGELGDIGIYEMAELARLALAGKDAYSTRDEPKNVIFWMREEPGPWVNGGVLYTVTLEIKGQVND